MQMKWWFENHRMFLSGEGCKSALIRLTTSCLGTSVDTRLSQHPRAPAPKPVTPDIRHHGTSASDITTSYIHHASEHPRIPASRNTRGHPHPITQLPTFRQHFHFLTRNTPIHRHPQVLRLRSSTPADSRTLHPRAPHATPTEGTMTHHHHHA